MYWSAGSKCESFKCITDGFFGDNKNIIIFPWKMSHVYPFLLPLALTSVDIFFYFISRSIWILHVLSPLLCIISYNITFFIVFLHPYFCDYGIHLSSHNPISLLTLPSFPSPVRHLAPSVSPTLASLISLFYLSLLICLLTSTNIFCFLWLKW